MTQSEYRLRPEISNSDIGNYIYGGIKYYMTKRESDVYANKRYFDLGEALHCYLLEPEEFDKRFKTGSSKLTGMMSNFVDALVALEAESNQDMTTDELHKAAYEASGYSIPLTRVLNEFNKPAIKKAYEEKKESIGKILLDDKQMELIRNMKASILSNKSANNLIFTKPHADLEIHNELILFWEHCVHEKHELIDTLYYIQCKSRLDRVIINKATKTVILVDLKTTGKPVKQFYKAYKLYRYYRQMAYYVAALKHWLSSRPEYKDWDIITKLVVVGTSFPIETKVFTVSPEDLEYGTKEYEEALTELNWHLTTQNFVCKNTLEGVDEVLNLKEITAQLGENDGERAEDRDSTGL